MMQTPDEYLKTYRKFEVLGTYLETNLAHTCEKYKLKRKQAIEICLTAARQILESDKGFAVRAVPTHSGGRTMIEKLSHITARRKTWKHYMYLLLNKRKNAD